MTEETARLGLKVKIIETGGASLKNFLVKLDLTGCVFLGSGLSALYVGDEGRQPHQKRHSLHWQTTDVLCVGRMTVTPQAS